MYYLFVPLLLAALGLPLSVSASLCNSKNQPMHAMGWYEGWNAAKIPPSSIPYEKYSAITFAFATTTNNAAQINLDAISTTTLPQLVKEAHDHNVLVMLSIGGFTGSPYFSTAVTSENRTTFRNAVMALVNQYEVDGVEFDWEYPNKQTGCNTISPDDSANFLAFLQDLRSAIGNKTIAAAVGVTVWNGPDGAPLADVSAYAKVLDYISIMNYDIYGAWSPTAGPNAPVNQTCEPANDQGSAVFAVNNWMKAGFPSNQIALGVAAYAHSFRVSSANAFKGPGVLALFPTADTTNPPLGPDDPPSGTGVDQCGKPAGPSGVLSFGDMVNQGYLLANGTHSTGMDFIFDTCSETPYVYNPNTEVMVSYDNAASFFIKGEFITDSNLAGFNMWFIGGDTNDILIDSISKGMGIQQCT